MLVRDIMSEAPQAVAPDTTVAAAARLMRDIGTGFLPVCDSSRLVGTVTDRDLVIRVTAQGRHPDQATVGEAMTEAPVCCFEDEDEQAVARVMADFQIRRVPVLDRANRMVGIVSLGDLATRGSDDLLTGRTAESVYDTLDGVFDLRAGGF